MSHTKEHYSYRVYADPETARTFDSERFGGAIGEWLKQTQEQLVFDVLLDVSGWNVIDVGAGTGRFTVPLIGRNAKVVACDASSEMLQVLQEKLRSDNLQVVVGDAHKLEFPDRTFDCAMSFRMLMHVLDWKQALGELCRVSKDWVVVDFPPRRGFLFFAPIWHRVSSMFKKNVQAYHTLPISQVKTELARRGFELISRDSGFFFPVVVHRTIGSAGFTRASERLFGAIGLTRLAGSPVTVFARRKK
jgi:ubiquinone/menaquinone biosynthesis C-methylase UbiE